MSALEVGCWAALIAVVLVVAAVQLTRASSKTDEVARRQRYRASVRALAVQGDITTDQASLLLALEHDGWPGR